MVRYVGGKEMWSRKKKRNRCDKYVLQGTNWYLCTVRAGGAVVIWLSRWAQTQSIAKEPRPRTRQRNAPNRQMCLEKEILFLKEREICNEVMASEEDLALYVSHGRSQQKTVIWVDVIKPGHYIVEHQIQLGMLRWRQRESAWLRGSQGVLFLRHPLRYSWVTRDVENSRACCEQAELVIPGSPVLSLLWKPLVRRGCCGLSATVETEVEERDAYILAAAVHYIHEFHHCLWVLAWWLELRKLLSARQVGLQLPTEDICIPTILFPFWKLHTWAS